MESKHLVDWLRDAHAMEKQAEKMLQSQAHRLEHYPQLQQRIEEHIEETVNQSKKLEHCLTLLGANTSSFKDMGAELRVIVKSGGWQSGGSPV